MISCPPLLGITDHPERGDAHWRLVRPFARLREQGVTTDICWLGPDEMPTISTAGRVVVLQRVAARGKQEAEVRAWVQRLRDAGALAVVYECDDDVVSPAYMAYLDACGGLDLVSRDRLYAEHQALIWTMQACDAVTVTTEPLAEVVRRYTAAPVHVVPNAIDADWFRARLAPRAPWDNYVTIGWAGGRRPEADLAPMAVAWARIAQRYPDVRFVVAGWQSDVIYREMDAAGIDILERIIHVPWADLDDYSKSMQVDIGCTSLADTSFNRCKSPIKAWEYALAGAAVVTSSVVYRDCATGNAVQAEGADEWEVSLRLLIESARTRRGAARLLSDHVERHHSLTANLQNWARVYSEIASSVGVTV